MADFKHFAKAVYDKFNEMSKGELFVTDVDTHQLTELYLDSFPAGTNEIYRERRGYDCSCCKSFIRKLGNVVSINNGKITTIWDVDVKYPFDKVCQALSVKVKSSSINSVFLINEKRVGMEHNFERMTNGDIKQWDHFYQ